MTYYLIALSGYALAGVMYLCFRWMRARHAEVVRKYVDVAFKYNELADQLIEAKYGKRKAADEWAEFID